MEYNQDQKEPQYWSGKDCQYWAASVCEKHRFSQFDINLHAFEALSGPQLLCCSQQDIVRLVGLNYGELFYKELHSLKNDWAANEIETLHIGSYSYLSGSNIVNTSAAYLPDPYGFNNSSGTPTSQSIYSSDFQPQLTFTEPTNNVSYTSPGLMNEAQIQIAYATQNNDVGQEPVFTQEKLEDLKIIDETIVGELSESLQSSYISEFQSGYSESNSLYHPSGNSSCIDAKYCLMNSLKVPDMYGSNISISSTLSDDQSFPSASALSYNNYDQLYGPEFTGGINKQKSYKADQYDYLLLHDVKPNVVEEEENYTVPDLNIIEKQNHNCLFDSIQNPNRKSRRRGPKVWEFVLRCLLDSQYNPSLVSWEDPSTGTFRIVQPEHLAKLWGARTGKPDLSYENFSRSLRYHYKHGILEGLSDRPLVYRFTPQALQAFWRNNDVHM